MKPMQQGITLTELLTVVNIIGSFSGSARPPTSTSPLPIAGQTQRDANSTTWQKGWIVVSDVNGNQQVGNATNIMLRRQTAFTSSRNTFAGAVTWWSN
jgi:Tfp pilus assembly protein FimT